MRPTACTIAKVLGAALVLGCSDGGPASNDTNNQLDGEWRYSIAPVERPSGDVCRYSDVILELQQDGAFFSGIARGGFLICQRESGVDSVPAELQTVSDGRFDGDSIHFDILGDDFMNAGIVAGEEMEGEVRILQDDPQPLISSFEAFKLD